MFILTAVLKIGNRHFWSIKLFPFMVFFLLKPNGFVNSVFTTIYKKQCFSYAFFAGKLLKKFFPFDLFAFVINFCYPIEGLIFLYTREYISFSWWIQSIISVYRMTLKHLLFITRRTTIYKLLLYLWMFCYGILVDGVEER